MLEVLKNVGDHDQYGTGHYEAKVLDDGTVIINTIFDAANQIPEVRLTKDQWFRLSDWVEWAEEYRESKDGHKGDK